MRHTLMRTINNQHDVIHLNSEAVYCLKLELLILYFSHIYCVKFFSFHIALYFIIFYTTTYFSLQFILLHS